MSSDKKYFISKELNTAIKLLGDDWVLCIVCNLYNNKKMRFNELQRAVTGINPVTLSTRLKQLEKDGIVKREEETLDKVSVVYSLTPKGEAIHPIIDEIAKFGKKFS